ncbi:adenylosuccinate lyase [uncultured Dokdonia sp.]|uniref:adenylosuccinate lyase n=1 Tax=uncultured Dokdonia sp. TaxID=575653 RepID=UPI0026380A1A|nr:adenylosuccinate lyase [uncultured Dokdonia sp.]
MTLSELYNELAYVNHSREKRAYYAQLILNKPSLTELVIEILFMVDDARSPKAGWIAEFATKEDITIILPHLELFTTKMHTVYQDAALRPVSKICEELAISYFKIKNPQTRASLTKIQRERMVTSAFDWLITDQKVAVKAYSMTSLYYLGTEFNWIHEDLQRIMEENYMTSSAAYKARCKHITAWIKRDHKYKNS